MHKWLPAGWNRNKPVFEPSQFTFNNDMKSRRVNEQGIRLSQPCTQIPSKGAGKCSMAEVVNRVPSHNEIRIQMMPKVRVTNDRIADDAITITPVMVNC